MKEAKKKFENLAERIKSGEDVSFGQIERVYAEGFLQSFLERSTKQRERAVTNLRRQQREFQDDYEEDIEDSFSNEAIDRQELDYLRNVVETLGVKPSINQLHQYTERAIKRGDWEILGDVLSISQEGNLGAETLESLAVKELEAGRTDSYRHLKKQFPEIEVSPDKANLIYSNLLSVGDLRKLREVREEINIPVSEEVCQISYENLLNKKNKSSIRAMCELREASGVTPKATHSIIESFRSLYSPESDLGREDLDKLDELFVLFGTSNHADIVLATLAQRAALEAERIDDFAYLWDKSFAKVYNPAREDVINNYKVLDQNKNYDLIFKLMEITGISPKGDIFSRTASVALEKSNDLRGIKNLIEIAKENPELSQTSVDNFSEKTSSKGDTESLVELSKIGGKIKPEYVHTTATRFIEKDSSDDFDNLEQRVNEFYKSFKLKPSTKVSGAKISKLTSILERDISESIREFTQDHYPNLDPLTPIKGSNLSHHNKFKSKVRGLLRSYTSKAKKIKSENKDLEISASDQHDPLRNIYSTCLELNLAQILIGDNKYLRLEDLVELTGISPSKDEIRRAVYSHVLKNYNQIGNVPEGLIEKLAKPGLVTSGIKIEVDSEIHNQVASNLVHHSKDIGRSLSYLKKITGIQDFSEQVYSSARYRIVDDLSKLNMSQYNTLKEFGIDVRNLNDEEKKRITREIIYKLKEDPNLNIYYAEKIVELTGIQLQADTYDLKEMVRKYFNSRENTKPSRIANLVNQKLNQDQIFNREIELIHEGYEYRAKELYNDTGISPTETGARNVIQRYNPQSREEIKRRLKFVFGQNLDLS